MPERSTRVPCPVARSVDHAGLALGVLIAREVAIGSGNASLDAVVEAAIRRASSRDERDEPLRTAVRDMLRVGGFKPTGRNKPSSEYIANAAARGAFPRINNCVDVANVVSIESGLPVSLLDLDRALGGAAGLEVRFGHPGEAFVFNRSGQEIDVSGLVCVARVEGPALGNPVKDAMSAKTDDRTRNLVACVYAPWPEVTSDRLAATVSRFAELLAAHADCSDPQWWELQP